MPIQQASQKGPCEGISLIQTLQVTGHIKLKNYIWSSHMMLYFYVLIHDSD